MEFVHKPVLLRECMEALHIRPDGTYLDGTLGGAGHAEQIVRRLTTGRLIGVDQDETALCAAGERLAPYIGRVTLVRDNFRNLKRILQDLQIPQLDGILLDLGVSSPQLDDGGRGFSYLEDAPLDMRMDRRAGLTAYEVVNTWPREELRRILYQYGEERYAPQIAAAIDRRRRQRPVATTLELAEADPFGHAASGPAGEAASGQAQLPGHPHRGKRRAGGGGAGHGRCRALSGPRRAAGGDYLPLAGGSDCKKCDAGSGQGLYLPAGVSRVCLREEAPGEMDDTKTGDRRSGGAAGQPQSPQRQAPRL